MKVSKKKNKKKNNANLEVEIFNWIGYSEPMTIITINFFIFTLVCFDINIFFHILKYFLLLFCILPVKQEWFLISINVNSILLIFKINLTSGLSFT